MREHVEPVSARHPDETRQHVSDEGRRFVGTRLLLKSIAGVCRRLLAEDVLRLVTLSFGAI